MDGQTPWSSSLSSMRRDERSSVTSANHIAAIRNVFMSHLTFPWRGISVLALSFSLLLEREVYLSSKSNHSTNKLEAWDRYMEGKGQERCIQARRKTTTGTTFTFPHEREVLWLVNLVSRSFSVNSDTYYCTLCTDSLERSLFHNSALTKWVSWWFGCLGDFILAIEAHTAFTNH